MLKKMTLWNGHSFYFHSSQESALLNRELNARAVLLKSSGGGAAEYCNKDIPVLWARTESCLLSSRPTFGEGAGHAE